MRATLPNLFDYSTWLSLLAFNVFLFVTSILILESNFLLISILLALIPALGLLFDRVTSRKKTKLEKCINKVLDVVVNRNFSDKYEVHSWLVLFIITVINMSINFPVIVSVLLPTKQDHVE